MKKICVAFIAMTLVLLLAPLSGRGAGEDAKQILRKTVERKFKDMTMNVSLVKVSRIGHERTMDLVVKIKDDGQVRKTLAEFTGPIEVKGMKSLTWDYADPARETDRFFKLAGLDYVKCRGKACEKMEDRFGFSMEIFAVELDQGTHVLLGEEKVGGADCYHIRSVIKTEDDPDGRVIISWIDKDKYAARKIEVQDSTGAVTQSSTFTEFQQVGDHWWEVKGELKKLDSGKTVKFQITKFEIDTGIEDAIFQPPEKFATQDKD